MIMQDGLPTGTLSYQSGDHAEPLDVMSMERLEVCLLYTSDAADERSSVDLGGRRIIKKKNHVKSG